MVKQKLTVAEGGPYMITAPQGRTIFLAIILTLCIVKVYNVRR